MKNCENNWFGSTALENVVTCQVLFCCFILEHLAFDTLKKAIFMFFKLRNTALKHGMEYLRFLPWKCLLCLHHPIFWCKHSWQEWFGVTLLCLGVKVRSCPLKSLSVTALLAECGLSSMGTTQGLGSCSLLHVPHEAGEGGTGKVFFSLTVSSGLLSGTVVMGTCSPCLLCPSVTFCSGAGLYTLKLSVF